MGWRCYHVRLYQRDRNQRLRRIRGQLRLATGRGEGEHANAWQRRKRQWRLKTTAITNHEVYHAFYFLISHRDFWLRGIRKQCQLLSGPSSWAHSLARVHGLKTSAEQGGWINLLAPARTRRRPAA